MIHYPSNVLVNADYEKYHFRDKLKRQFDFVLSCGDVQFQVFEEIHELYRKPIFAVKGNHDLTKSFPDYVTDVHHNIVQHRNCLIRGWQGVPSYKGTGPYEWDDMGVELQLSKFPYMDIFICHAPVSKLTDKEDYAHLGSDLELY